MNLYVKIPKTNGLFYQYDRRLVRQIKSERRSYKKGSNSSWASLKDETLSLIIEWILFLFMMAVAMANVVVYGERLQPRQQRKCSNIGKSRRRNVILSATLFLSFRELNAAAEISGKNQLNFNGGDNDDESTRIVEEAWEVVNQTFLDARQNKWSSTAWLAQKEKRSIPNKAAAYSVIKSMLSTLDDPFTRFLTPEEFARLSKYDITGIGLNIGEVDNGHGETCLRVIGILLDGAAQLAGIQKGDEIIRVDGQSMLGKPAFEVASAIQGRKGTSVSIEVRREDSPNLYTFTVNRQQELPSPVSYRLERADGERRGYIRIKEFNALARKDLVIAMERLKSSGASTFVLDLRDNLGGLVQEGIEVAKSFLEAGETVIYTERRDSNLSKAIVAQGPSLTKAPLVILVNERTASASEIVAAALRDNCRAVLVGSKTFGKGLIQSVYELSDGSGVILTVGKYVTPRHTDIDRNGLQPDYKKIPGDVEAAEKLRLCQEQQQ